MASTNINIRTDTELKARAQAVFYDLGLDMSTAVNIFLKQVVYKQSIPFSIDKRANPRKKKDRSAVRGILRGKVWMADDFNAPIDDLRDYM